MEEEGVVVGVPEPGLARVRVTRSAACQGCGACGFCHSFEGSPDVVAEVRDPIGVREGQRVLLSLPAGAVLKASLAVYIVPLVVLLVAGGAVQGLVLAFLPSWDAQLAGVLAGLAAMGLTFAALRRIYRRRAEESLRARVKEVLAG